MLLVKVLYRIRARQLASKSLWHGRSSELVREYMDVVDHNLSNFNRDTLEGCKYLVYGESKENITKGASPSINDLKSVVSLDNIWLHDGSTLLRTINERKNTVKDLTLAFALSRLLRCRMEGGMLDEDTISLTKELICSRIIRADDNVDRVLAGNLLMDISFLGEHIHTGFPMVFCQGLRSLFFHALQCIVQLTCLFWLLVDIFPHFSTDVLVTVPTVAVILGMKMFEAFSCIWSNWTLLVLVCKYVNCHDNRRMEHIFERMISSVLGFKEEPLVSFSSRYDFLQSSNYSKGKLRLSPFNEHLSGGRLIRRTCCNTVIAAVIRALARYMDEEGRRLPRHCLSERAQRYWSACLELPSCSHVILVWHIATSLCQAKLEQGRGYTNNSGLFRFFVGNTKPDFAGKLSKANTVANCLSRYCLDLLISKPSLLPENLFVSKKLLLDTIQHAHDSLRGCNSPKSKYDELIALSLEAAVPAGDPQDIKLTGNILIQGAMMGKELIDSEDEEGRWEILAEVWADILLQIAPSSKAEAHGRASSLELSS